MLYRTIICATDGEPHSADALRHAVRLVTATGAAFHVVHITDWPRSAGLLPGELMPPPREVRERVKAELAAIALEHEISLVAHYPRVDGHVADTIARIAEEVDADLIVVGSHGRSPLGATLTGSVSVRLPHLTARPIVVVPHHAEGWTVKDRRHLRTVA